MCPRAGLEGLRSCPHPASVCSPPNPNPARLHWAVGHASPGLWGGQPGQGTELPDTFLFLHLPGKLRPLVLGSRGAGRGHRRGLDTGSCHMNGSWAVLCALRAGLSENSHIQLNPSDGPEQDHRITTPPGPSEQTEMLRSWDQHSRAGLQGIVGDTGAISRPSPRPCGSLHWRRWAWGLVPGEGQEGTLKGRGAHGGEKCPGETMSAHLWASQVPVPLQRGLGLPPLEGSVTQESGSSRAAPMCEEGAGRCTSCVRAAEGEGALDRGPPAGLGPGRVNWSRRRSGVASGPRTGCRTLFSGGQEGFGGDYV